MVQSQSLAIWRGYRQSFLRDNGFIRPDSATAMAVGFFDANSVFAISDTPTRIELTFGFFALYSLMTCLLQCDSMCLGY